MPTQRWKQQAVTLPQWRCISTLLIRSSRALVEMGEAVYLLARQRRCVREELPALGVVRAVEGRRHRADGRRDEGVLRQVLDLLPHDVGFEMEVLQRGYVFVSLFDGHFLVLLC